MENTLNANNANNEATTEQGLIESVKRKLNSLSLPAEWAAKQISVTGGYLRKIFAGELHLTARIKEKLIELNKKLEQIEMILKAA